MPSSTANPTHAHEPVASVLRRRTLDQLNFLLTNRIPRRLFTRAMGRLSKLRTGPLTPALIAIWRLLDRDLDLSDSKQQHFNSLHECFTRELRPGTRPIHPDPAIITSPADAILGAHGAMQGLTALQAKERPYGLIDLLGYPELVERYRDGCFITLRLKSSFYHRFHAPCTGRLQRLIYIAGDTWNVNPPALQRIDRLFCKNERAVFDLQLEEPGQHLTMVAVAAILVASIRVHCLPYPLSLQYRGPNLIACNHAFHRGEELGYFEHGSTILLFASRGFRVFPGLKEGSRLQMGQPLLTRPSIADLEADNRSNA
jgi:phosphatidylserine decarboxylase